MIESQGLYLASLLGMILAFLIGVIFHEVAHGYVADRLGDPTARISGRLTFDPRAHIDPFGTILLPLLLLIVRAPFIFGWAKPVPFDPYNLRNPRQGIFLISIAGIITNLLIATIAAILFHLLVIFLPPTLPFVAIAIILQFIIGINVLLAVFNLIPIPPLDGSKVLMSILPEDLAEDIRSIEPYGIFLIILLWLVPAGRYSSLLVGILQVSITFVLGLLRVPSPF